MLALVFLVVIVVLLYWRSYSLNKQGAENVSVKNGVMSSQSNAYLKYEQMDTKFKKATDVSKMVPDDEDISKMNELKDNMHPNEAALIQDGLDAYKQERVVLKNYNALLDNDGKSATGRQGGNTTKLKKSVTPAKIYQFNDTFAGTIHSILLDNPSDPFALKMDELMVQLGQDSDTILSGFSKLIGKDGEVKRQNVNGQTGYVLQASDLLFPPTLNSVMNSFSSLHYQWGCLDVIKSGESNLTKLSEGHKDKMESDSKKYLKQIEEEAKRESKRRASEQSKRDEESRKASMEDEESRRKEMEESFKRDSERVSRSFEQNVEESRTDESETLPSRVEGNVESNQVRPEANSSSSSVNSTNSSLRNDVNNGREASSDDNRHAGRNEELSN